MAGSSLLLAVATAVVALVLPQAAKSFAISPCGSPRSSFSALQMGLYDEPLPPPPPSKNETRAKKKQLIEEGVLEYDDFADLPVLGKFGEGEGDDVFQRKVLFTMMEDGTEMNDRLPPLSRTLKTGIGCYYEPGDRQVQNLVKKTDCHPDDAAWALEACKGDVTEAWTRISMARRLILNESTDRMTGSMTSEIADLMAENEFEMLKRERAEQQKKDRRWNPFDRGTPDEDWLPAPTKNPRPVDDEPWYTG